MADSTTALTLAYGAWAQDGLVMADQGIDLVFAAIYAKYVPAFVQTFVPPTTVTNIIDAEFASLEVSVKDKSLTFDTHNMILKSILEALMTSFPALEQALAGLSPAIVAELKQLGVLK